MPSDQILNNLKRQLDPAIHQLLAYDVTGDTVAITTTEVLADIEKLTMRAQLRMVSKDTQKAVFTATQKNNVASQNTPMKIAEEGASSEAPSSNKRGITWDKSKPMTTEGITAMNAAKKQRGTSGPKGGRMDSFFAKKMGGPSTTKVADAKKVHDEAVGSIYSKKSKVLFKFQQGFSNAVRRPVSISEFL